jgi:CBS domain-containing protein
VLVRDAASRDIVSLPADQSVADIRTWLATRAPGTGHQGFPVIDANGELVGVVTRRDLIDLEHDDERLVGQLLKRPPVVVFEDNTLREAADHMVHESVGRLAVVTREQPRVVVGIVSRSDLLDAHRHRLDAALITESPPIGRGWLRRQERTRSRKREHV